MASVGRYWHASAALADGRVLIAGGAVSGSPHASSAEIYDPSTNSWTPEGALSVSRYLPGGGRLPSGKILIAGGERDSTPSRVVDIYDPAARVWSVGPSLISAQGRSVMHRLPDGRLLIVGDGPTPEVFDESTNTWTQTGPIATTRQPSLATLTSGMVMACGGYGDGGSPKAACSIYNPSTNTWSATGAMKQARIFFLLAPLPSGGALVAGGDYGGPLSSAETWDPTAGTWSSAAPMRAARMQLAGGALPDGKVLAAFGTNATAEVFDPSTSLWIDAASATVPRLYAQAVTTTTGSIVFTGGMNATTFSLISTPEVFTQQAIGATCRASGDCASGFCVDGVCCNTNCAASCSACDLPGKVGTCNAVDGAAPRGGRSCGSFAKCVAGACVTSCTDATDCASDKYCVSGACVARKSNGLACAAGTECTSGFCVDGVCCGSACTAQCAACDVAGSFGVCTPFAGQPRGGRPGCSGAGVGTTCGQQCDGVDSAACKYPSASISCGSDSCTDAIETRAGACDGAGACVTTAKSCGAYACSGVSCRTTCATNAECAPGNYCKSGTCIAFEGLGKVCTSGADCTTGHCVDGVCCGSASCETGATCASTKAAGRCAKLPGGKCTIDEECGSGFCTDGVCCDARCDGQCEACDVAGSAGVCSPVVGNPHGARTKCEGDTCAARTCDGTTRASCRAFAAGPETACSPPTCKGDTLTLAGKCDGAGACVASATSSCVPFACVGRACATSCTVDAECAADFRCSGGTCVARGAKCSEDGVSSIPTGGEPRSCAPYRCQSSGECGTRCESSSQCAPGAVCDLASSTCVASVAAAEEGSGCSMGARGTGSLAPFAVLLALALVVRRRSPIALLAALTLIGCSTSSRPTERARVLAPVRAHAPFAARIADARAPGSIGLARAFPKSADGALAMHARGAEVIVRALDVRAVLGEVVEATTVYANAAEQTDLVLLQTSGLTEELRVLHGPAAPSTLRWSLSGDVSFAVERGRVIARDAKGATVLQTDELDAIDARGTRRVARLSLEGATLTAQFDLAGMTYPIVVDPAWSMGPTMTSERREHSAVRLADGRVLITGGMVASTPLSTAEIYDPTTNTFTAIAPMHRTHAAHGSVLLPDGAVLVGGYSPPTTEIYNPTAGTWQDLGYLPSTSGKLIGLADGRVLAIGGCSNTLDVFNPTTKSWAAGPPMNEARFDAQQVRLDDGRVLVLGGSACSSGVVSSAELYDPSANSWTTVAPPPSSFGSLVALPSKRALLTSSPKTATVFDATSNTWTTKADMLVDHYSHASAVLPNGRVLVIGGQSQLVAEVWDPIADTWSRAGGLSRTRMRYPIAPLTSGALLITGGLAGTTGTLSTSELFALVSNGGSCTEAGECSSGFCVSGICCNTSCSGTCSACDESGKVGTCSPLDGEPHYGRTCTGGFSCEAGACRTTCSTNAHCSVGEFCLSGACVTKKPLGDACTTTAECVSGVCVDGVCCDRACGAQCEACDLPSSKGTCTGVVGAPRGGRPLCTGTGLGTECGPSCDGKDLTKCTLAKTTTFCSATRCAAGVETHASFCDGAGACRDVATPCGAYGCGAFACKVTCTGNADCATGHYCKGSACTKIEDLGVACTDGASCKTGFCVDGVCCATSSCDAGSTCAGKGREGTCSRRNGASCVASTDCGSGNCVDGVCCDRACDGRCEACDVTGSFGTCVAVVGAPHGVRPACDAGGSPCSATSCDGVDGKSCAALAGASVKCGTPSCSGTTFSGSSHCDGKGACAAAEATSCSPYVCDAEGCLTSCTTDAQCASGFECRAGVCDAKRARCNDDLSESIAIDGAKTPCSPYRCGPTGTCLSECATSSDCGGGHVCDGRACVPVSSIPAEEGSGCAVGVRSTTGAGAFFAFALGLALRRSRARRPR